MTIDSACMHSRQQLLLNPVDNPHDSIIASTIPAMASVSHSSPRQPAGAVDSRGAPSFRGPFRSRHLFRRTRVAANSGTCALPKSKVHICALELSRCPSASRETCTAIPVHRCFYPRPGSRKPLTNLNVTRAAMFPRVTVPRARGLSQQRRSQEPRQYMPDSPIDIKAILALAGCLQPTYYQ